MIPPDFDAALADLAALDAEQREIYADLAADCERHTARLLAVADRRAAVTAILRQHTGAGDGT